MTMRKFNTNPEIYQNLQQMTVSQLIAEMREGKPPASYGDLDYEEMTLMFTDLLEAAYAAQVIILSKRISVLQKVYDAARKALKSCIEHDSLYSASTKTVHHRRRKFGRARSRAKNP